MGIVIRDVEAGDLEVVLQINDAAVPHVNRIGMDQMRKFRHEAAYFRVAVVDDAVAAFLVGLTPEADYDSPNFRWFCARYPSFAYIDRVAVHEASRRYGLAGTLYQDLERAIGYDAPRLVCEVNLRPPNEISMEFHRRQGFRQVGTQVLEGGRKEVAMLVKELD